MRPGVKTFSMGILLGLAALGLTATVEPATAAGIQDVAADAGLLERIAGSYEFEYQGQVMVFVFFVEDGKLKGAPEGEEPEELEPMEGVEAGFLGYSPDGTEYRFTFKKDDEGGYGLCLCSVPDMGVEVEGRRIK